MDRATLLALKEQHLAAAQVSLNIANTYSVMLGEKPVTSMAKLNDEAAPISEKKPRKKKAPRDPNRPASAGPRGRSLNATRVRRGRARPAPTTLSR